jgi:hypothetical protein
MWFPLVHSKTAYNVNIYVLFQGKAGECYKFCFCWVYIHIFSLYCILLWLIYILKTTFNRFFKNGYQVSLGVLSEFQTIYFKKHSTLQIQVRGKIWGYLMFQMPIGEGAPREFNPKERSRDFGSLIAWTNGLFDDSWRWPRSYKCRGDHDPAPEQLFTASYDRFLWES